MYAARPSVSEYFPGWGYPLARALRLQDYPLAGRDRAEGEGEMIMKALVGMAALLAATSGAFAQNAKAPTPAKPHVAVGCKLVGTVKGTKLWAGDCTDAAGLRGPDAAAPQLLPEQAGTAIPPGQKQ